MRSLAGEHLAQGREDSTLRVSPEGLCEVAVDLGRMMRPVAGDPAVAALEIGEESLQGLHLGFEQGDTFCVNTVADFGFGRGQEREELVDVCLLEKATIGRDFTRFGARPHCFAKFVELLHFSMRGTEEHAVVFVQRGLHIELAVPHHSGV